MNKDLIVKKLIDIDADCSRVWEALTTPEIVKQYFFGTELISDFILGGEIVFQGDWEGKKYRDKGIILKIIPEEILQYSYWSAFSGLEDKEENYATVSYNLEEINGKTILLLTQAGFANEEAQKHSDAGWEMVLNAMKSLIEDV